MWPTAWRKSTKQRHPANGKLNPADDASRGLSPQKLSTNHRWWNGPEFLIQERKNWPETKVSEVPKEDTEAHTEVKIHHVNAISTRSELLQRLTNYHSVWSKLQRHVAWLVRFFSWIRSKKEHCNAGILSLEELNYASNLIIRDVQKESFAEELDYLFKGNEVESLRVAS